MKLEARIDADHIVRIQAPDSLQEAGQIIDADFTFQTPVLRLCHRNAVARGCDLPHQPRRLRTDYRSVAGTSAPLPGKLSHGFSQSNN